MNGQMLDHILTMSTTFEDADHFGYASTKTTLREVIQLLHDSCGDDARCAAAAYGMLLAAHLCPDGAYYTDAMRALDYIGLAKMVLDSAVCHAPSVIHVTSTILLNTQQVADDMTVPCTEWPNVRDIVTTVFQQALTYAKTSDWKLVRYGANGMLIGTYIAVYEKGTYMYRDLS